MTTFLGKTLLVAALCFEAFSLYSHQDTISKFNTNFERGLRRVSFLSSDAVSFLSDKETMVRMLVIVHYALSLLMIVTKSKLVKFLVMLGVVLNTLIMSNPYVDKSESVHFLLLQNLAIIGGLLFLQGEKNDEPKKVVLPSETRQEVKSGDSNPGKTGEKSKKKKV